MAELQKNKTTGKAIADIHAVYFLKHENGEEPNIIEHITDENLSKLWFPVLTLRGTVNTSQSDPTIEKINVDQFDAPIGMTTEPGDFTFEAQLPSLAKADLEKWLEIETFVNEDGTPVTIDGRQVVGMDLTGEIYEMSVLIQTRTKGTIIFSNAQVAFSFSKEDKVFLFKVTGQIMAAQNEENKMLYLATEAAHFTVSSLALPSTKSMAVGDQLMLSTDAGFSVTPAQAVGDLKWSSDNKGVAKVYANGMVQAVSAGQANITATSHDGTKSATCKVTVTAEP